MNLEFQFRQAQPQDVEDAIPLIFSAGPQAVDYGFQSQDKTSEDFLRFSFVDGKGFLGCQNHTVITIDGKVVGIAAFYNFSTYARLSLEHFRQLWHFYPAPNLADLVTRGFHLKSIMPPPAQTMHYVAHFGVVKDLRGLGLGRSLLDYHYKIAQNLGRTTYALDVSVENPRGLALYERYGFSVKAMNKFSGPQGRVPDTLRMTMRIQGETAAAVPIMRV